jgi:hypothetical protein
MYAPAFDVEGLEIDHVRTCTIDKYANLIVGMTMGQFSFVRIFSVLDHLAFYLIYMKGNVFIAFGEFVYVDIFKHWNMKVIVKKSTVKLNIYNYYFSYDNSPPRRGTSFGQQVFDVLLGRVENIH